MFLWSCRNCSWENQPKRRMFVALNLIKFLKYWITFKIFNKNFRFSNGDVDSRFQKISYCDGLILLIKNGPPRNLWCLFSSKFYTKIVFEQNLTHRRRKNATLLRFLLLIQLQHEMSSFQWKNLKKCNHYEAKELK